MPVSIVHICYNDATGGISTFLRGLLDARSPVDASHEILFIDSHSTNLNGVPSLSLRFRWGRFAGACRQAYRHLRSHDCFFVHAAHPAVLPALIVLGRRRTLLFQHGMTLGRKSLLGRAAKRLWYSIIPPLLGASVVCSTPEARRKLSRSGIRIADRRILYVPFGIDMTKHRRRLIGDSSGRLRIGMAGRLVASKRFDWVVASLRGLSTEHTVQIMIAGDGPERGNLAALARTVENNRIVVRLLGEVSDMSDFYGGLDLFIHPGADESFGMVVVEALAAATPVLVFKDVGPMLAAVHDRVNGFILGNRDALPEFWTLIDRDPDLLRRMRRNLERMDLATFSIEHTRKALDEAALAMTR